MHGGFSIDHENRVIRNVCLLGPESLNGHKYKASAIQEAAPKYSGRVVYIDHSQTPSKRSLRDKAGRVMANPRFENGRLFGDLKASKNAAGDLLLSEAQEQLDYPEAKDVGMSHVVEGRMSKSGKLVESIDKVISVDVVFKPATMTRGFAESECVDLELKEKLSSLLEGKKSAVERLKTIYEACEVDFKADEQELPAVPLIEDVDSLREYAVGKPALAKLIEQYDGLQRDKWIAEAIAEAKVPDTEATRKAFAKCATKELMVEHGKVLKEAIDAAKPVPGQKGREPAKTGLTVDAAVAAFKSMSA